METTDSPVNKIVGRSGSTRSSALLTPYYAGSIAWSMTRPQMLLCPVRSRARLQSSRGLPAWFVFGRQPFNRMEVHAETSALVARRAKAFNDYLEHALWRSGGEASGA